MTVLLVCVFGGIGALSRFVADGLIRTRLGRNLPFGTLIINVSGALILGIVTALTSHHHLPLNSKLVLGTGFCGGYTTFSTASFETVRLIEEKRIWEATLYALSNASLTFLVAITALMTIR
jgi:CrcB protein